jgi:hypothetical protein
MRVELAVAKVGVDGCCRRETWGSGSQETFLCGASDMDMHRRARLSVFSNLNNGLGVLSAYLWPHGSCAACGAVKPPATCRPTVAAAVL